MIFDNILYKITLNYIKKEPYTGSCNKHRYRVWKEKNEEKDEDIIKVCIYPDIFCYEKTSEDDKIYTEYAFSQEGLNEAINYIEQEMAK